MSLRCVTEDCRDEAVAVVGGRSICNMHLLEWQEDERARFERFKKDTEAMLARWREADDAFNARWGQHP